MSSPMEALAERVLRWSERGEIQLTDELLASLEEHLFHEHTNHERTRRREQS